MEVRKRAITNETEKPGEKKARFSWHRKIAKIH
jgi:hypothetical protein